MYFIIRAGILHKNERCFVMDERFYIQVGNCYAAFLGLRHELRMYPDYHNADPFLTEEKAKKEAKRRGLSQFKIVRRR